MASISFCSTRRSAGSAWATGRCSQVAAKAHRVVLGVEAERGAEAHAEGLQLGRLAVREAHLDRPPVRTAQLAQDVEHHRQRAVAHLVDRLDTRLVDLPVQRGDVAVHRERRSCAAHVRMQVAHEAAQRRLHVGRIAHQQPRQPDRMQAVALAHQQPEMRAAAALHGQGDQAVVHRQRDLVVGVVEDLRIDAFSGQQLGGVHAHAEQDVRHRQQRADAHQAAVCGPTVHRGLHRVRARVHICSRSIRARRFSRVRGNVKSLRGNVKQPPARLRSLRSRGSSG